MPLALSCDGLYFPSEKLDNVFIAQWTRSETESLSPNSIAVFKLKCTSPHLFHVVPRYGVFLLVDPQGAPVEPRVPISIRIGQYDHGRHGLDRQIAHTNDDMNAVFGARVDRARSRRSVSLVSGATAMSRGHRHERFVLECRLVQNQPPVYAYAAQHLFAESGKTPSMQVYKELWDLVDTVVANAPNKNLTTTMTTLRVYRDNVVLHPDSPSPVGDDANKVVVPAHITLVPSIMPSRAYNGADVTSGAARAAPVAAAAPAVATAAGAAGASPASGGGMERGGSTSSSSHAIKVAHPMNSNGTPAAAAVMRPAHSDPMSVPACSSSTTMKSLKQEIIEMRRDRTRLPGDGSSSSGATVSSATGHTNSLGDKCASQNGQEPVSSLANMAARGTATSSEVSKQQQQQQQTSNDSDDDSVIMKLPPRRSEASHASGIELRYVLGILMGVYLLVPLLRLYIMIRYMDVNDSDVDL